MKFIFRLLFLELKLELEFEVDEDLFLLDFESFMIFLSFIIDFNRECR